MNPILIILLILILVLLLIILWFIIQQNKTEPLQKSLQDFSNSIDQRLLESIQAQHNLETSLLKQQVEAQNATYIALQTHFKNSNETLSQNLNQINTKVSESLEKGFKSSHETFTDVIKRLTIIDETQKKIDALSTDIVSLQDVLTDKKTRGLFGEVQLNQILSSIFGEQKGRVYDLQYAIGSGRVDAVLFLPSPLGIIPIDSKFPLENYRRMVDAPQNSIEMTQASKLFVQDCKVHIQAITDKYIHPDQNITQAMMFIPAEAIFANINAYHPDIINFAQSKNVWLVSPTTLMSTLTTVQLILKDMQQQRHAQEIKHHLNRLAIEFNRYQERWDKLSNSIKSVSKHVDDISITSNKITRRFEDIHNVELSPINGDDEIIKLD